MDKETLLETEYLNTTLDLINEKLSKLKKSSENLEGVFNASNTEYFEYLKRNANKINEEDVVELVNMQGRLDDLQDDSINLVKQEITYNKI